MGIAVDERNWHQNAARRIADNHLLPGNKSDTLSTFIRGTILGALDKRPALTAFVATGLRLPPALLTLTPDRATFFRGTILGSVRRFLAPALLFTGFLFCHGCSKDYNGFGHHSIKSVTNQVEDYKNSSPLDTGPLKRSVDLYVLEEKRNAPNVREQVSDYMGTHRVDRESFLETWRRYLATQ